ncbi:hypothetical protein, partial [Klebsiella pneumoniae]|uniref:hypothetical protein n=1 Tax=Klebsiella pneumoniae TaxID=573 RepID=UPI002731538C|nr:hypothetical protein [Klebsiella pneumoniae]
MKISLNWVYALGSVFVAFVAVLALLLSVGLMRLSLICVMYFKENVGSVFGKILIDIVLHT